MTSAADADTLSRAMVGRGHVADADLAAALHLAGALGKPLLLEGEAGVGKTEVAKCRSAARAVRARATRSLDGPGRTACRRVLRRARSGEPDRPRKGAAAMNEPIDADARRAVPAIVCYDVDAVPGPDPAWLDAWRDSLEPVETVVVPPRDACAFRVPAGHAFRIVSAEGPQVGDLNLWNADDPAERFWSGKTRQLHASHVTTGDRLWSVLPQLRPLATITDDTLAWYGVDADGGRVHDVIGTRCDPYTNRLLAGVDYHHCCHSNLTRAFADATGRSLDEAERHVHDVLNVFMCTGFTRDTGQYFMKASPVRPGDAIEFLAEIDLLGALSTCPGGDCGSGHSDDAAPCFPLHVEILRPSDRVLAAHRRPPPSAYGGGHGRGRV